MISPVKLAKPNVRSKSVISYKMQLPEPTLGKDSGSGFAPNKPMRISNMMCLNIDYLY